MDDLDELLPPNIQNPYYDTWDRHNSIAFNTTKGLRNPPGENNCFVNSAVQVFWHLDVFRRSYRRLNGHTCMGNSCIFCALKVIFTQFQYSDQASFAPDALRKALADAFANQQRFQLGHMDDAAECFENILRRIHFHLASGCNEDTCSAPHCIPHRKFAMTVSDEVVCPCGASSKPLTFHEMVHYISTSALVSQARAMRKTGDELHPDRFGLLLRNAQAMGDIRDCPGDCGEKVQLRKTLLNCPDVVSIGLVWDSDHPSVEMTTEVASTIGTTILLQDVFHRVMQDVKTLPKLQLVGLVCYYGKHYSTFVFHSKFRIWFYFDDSNVREIGPHWEHVVDKCVRGRYQPLLLLYANPNAVPVSVDTALKKRVMAPGYVSAGVISDEIDGNLNRTQDSIASSHYMSGGNMQLQRRARTPNPDPQETVELTANGRRAVTPGPEYFKGEGLREARKTSDHHRQPSFLIAMTTKSGSRINSPIPGGAQSQPASESLVNGHYLAREDSLGSVQQNGSVCKMAYDQGYSSQQPNDAGHSVNSNGDGISYDNYTLSASDQYRRPSINSFDGSKIPLTQNFVKVPETHRKESFKKGKGKVPADVIRYHVDSSCQSSTSSSPSPEGNMGQPSFGDYVTMNGRGSSHDSQLKPPQIGKQIAGQALSQYPGLPPRCRSQPQTSGDKDSLSISSDTVNTNQHRVVKPKANGIHMYENIDNLSHTPVQSGLATLPRKKNNQSSNNSGNSSVVHQQQGSGNQEKGNLVRQASMGNLTCVESQRMTQNSYGVAPLSVWNGGQYQESVSPQKQAAPRPVTGGVYHEKQVSGGGKSDSGKPKKEKKSDHSGKSEKKRAHKKTKSGDSQDSVIVDKNGYIDRRMVETILSYQGLQRQVSTRSNSSQVSSSSSVDSDVSLMHKLLASKGLDGQDKLSVDIPFDNVSIGSHKDSGYGSSDRNSSSSTGSGTVDPYTQYFLSRSMIVPKTFNPQALQGGVLNGSALTSQPTTNLQCYSVTEIQRSGFSEQQGNKSQMEQSMDAKPLGVTFNPSEMLKEDLNRHTYETNHSRRTMHPIKESSYEDRLKDQLSDSGLESGTRPGVSTPPPPSGLRPPLPPKSTVVQQISQQVSASGEPTVAGLDKEALRNEKFVSLCRQAEDLMDQCMLAETSGEFAAALQSCDSATVVLKQAMSMPNLTHQSVVFAQRKHNACLLKSRSLMKKQQDANQKMDSSGNGKRSSVTSTDSEGTYTDSSNSRRSGSRESLDSIRRMTTNSDLKHSVSVPVNIAAVLHERQGSNSSHQKQCSGSGADNSSCPIVRTLSDHAVKDMPSHSHTHTDSNASNRSSTSSQASSHTREGSQDVSGGGADLYGTLPRRRSRKPSDTTPKNAEVYQAFLNKQKTLQSNTQVQHIRTSSGSSTATSVDGRDSDASSSDKGHSKMSKSDIRHLLVQDMIQRQQQQQPQKSQQHQQQLQQSRQYQHQQPQLQHQQLRHHPNQQQHQQQAQQHFYQHPQQLYPPPSIPFSNSQQPGMGYSNGPTSDQQPIPHRGQSANSLSQTGGRSHVYPKEGMPPPPYNHVHKTHPSEQYSVQSWDNNVPCVHSNHPPREKPDTPARSSSSTSGISASEVGRNHRVANMSSHQSGSGQNSRQGHLPPSHNASLPAASLSHTCVRAGPTSVDRKHYHGQSMGMSRGPNSLEQSGSMPEHQKLVESTYANKPDPRCTNNNLWGDNYSRSSFPDYSKPWHDSTNQHAPPHLPQSQSDPAIGHDNRNDCNVVPSSEQDNSQGIVSVRALASRFETAMSTNPTRTNSIRKSDTESSPVVQRVRSKSESRESSASKGPKSVLKKNKKSRSSRPRKSVTFSDNIDLIAAAELLSQGYISAEEVDSPRFLVDDRAYYSDDEDRHGQRHVSLSDNELEDVDDSSNSDDSPVPQSGNSVCQLCQKKVTNIGQLYCSKCQVYMNRFMPPR